jgi:hypothetical protein
MSMTFQVFNDLAMRDSQYVWSSFRQTDEQTDWLTERVYMYFCHDHVRHCIELHLYIAIDENHVDGS